MVLLEYFINLLVLFCLFPIFEWVASIKLKIIKFSITLKLFSLYFYQISKGSSKLTNPLENAPVSLDLGFVHCMQMTGARMK